MCDRNEDLKAVAVGDHCKSEYNALEDCLSTSTSVLYLLFAPLPCPPALPCCCGCCCCCPYISRSLSLLRVEANNRQFGKCQIVMKSYTACFSASSTNRPTGVTAGSAGAHAQPHAAAVPAPSTSQSSSSSSSPNK